MSARGKKAFNKRRRMMILHELLDTSVAQHRTFVSAFT
jgi:hypothetical protein